MTEVYLVTTTTTTPPCRIGDGFDVWPNYKPYPPNTTSSVGEPSLCACRSLD
jgi:hypothetical protein